MSGLRSPAAPTGPSTKVIVAGALMLFGGLLAGIGIHHVVSTGTCSSTGYTEYGPAPLCPKGTGLFVLYLIGGIFCAVGGSLVLGGAGAMAGSGIVFLAIGLGSLSCGVGPWATDTDKAFSIIFGGGFALGSLLWFGLAKGMGGTITVRQRR